jgi:hypothetical protein
VDSAIISTTPGDDGNVGIIEARTAPSLYPASRRHLNRVPYLKEYWFESKTYHAATDVAVHLK